jgi:hypothetical protein
VRAHTRDLRERVGVKAYLDRWCRPVWPGKGDSGRDGIYGRKPARDSRAERFHDSFQTHGVSLTSGSAPPSGLAGSEMAIAAAHAGLTQFVNQLSTDIQQQPH